MTIIPNRHETSSGEIYYILPPPDRRIHREDGPAVIGNDGSQFWYKYGFFHRLYGPAIIWTDGTEFWYINGHEVTDKIHKWANEMNIDLDNLSDEDKMLIRIYWENYDGK